MFDSAVVRNALSVTNTPTVQLSSLFEDTEESDLSYRQEIKENLIVAALREVNSSIEVCQIPTKEKLMISNGDSPLDWNAVECFCNDRKSAE